MATHLKQDDTNSELAAIVVELIALLDRADALIAAKAPVMSAAEKRRTVKAPPGCEAVIHTVSRLVESYGLTLPNHSVGAMTAALALSQALAPVVERTQLLMTKVGDATFSAKGRAWGSTLAYYTALSRVKGTDAELATALAPVTEFFTKRFSSTKNKPAQP